MIKSEIFSKIVEEKMKGVSKLLNYASDMGNLNNGVHQGDTVSILKWKHLGDAIDLKKGDKISTEEMDNTEEKVSVEHKAKGAIIYDIDKATCIDGQSIEDRAAKQIAEVLVRAKEISLGNKMLNVPLKFATKETNSITAAELNMAMTTAFGDSQDVDSFACILVNSQVAMSFYSMPEFVDVNKTFVKGENGIIRNGLIGYFRGIPVVMSDVVTKDSNECVTFIIKKSSIGYKNLPSVGIETERDAGTKSDKIFGDDLFATAVIDDSGVVVLRKTISK